MEQRSRGPYDGSGYQPAPPPQPSVAPDGYDAPPPEPGAPPGPGGALAPRRGLLEGIIPWGRLREEVDQLREETGRLREEAERRRADLADQNEQLQLLYRAVHDLREDTTTELKAAHHETARWYGELRKKIDDLAGEAVIEQFGPDEAARHEWHVRLTTQLCRTAFAELPSVAPDDWHRAAAVLFGGDGSALGDISGLWQDVAALRTTIAGLGGVHRWDFEVPSGQAYDAERYDLWRKSDGRRRVSHCVAPAYRVVGRQPHTKALVHTAVG